MCQEASDALGNVAEFMANGGAEVRPAEVFSSAWRALAPASILFVCCESVVSNVSVVLSAPCAAWHEPVAAQAVRATDMLASAADGV